MNHVEHFDVVVVGTGFASSFFLLEYLRLASARTRVLVLERGFDDGRAELLRHRILSRTAADRTFHSRGRGHKRWAFTIGFGGGSNCWWGCTPRLLPSDFRLRSLYGVGQDWPVDYEELEPDYEQVEAAMAISGPVGTTPFPRRKAYPQPPHRLSSADRLLARAFPGLYFAQPTARARLPVAGRAACCASGVCSLCPANAKWTVENGMQEVYADPRVSVRFGEEVVRVEVRGGTVSGVIARREHVERRIGADLVVLGANALFNAAILLRSGVEHPRLGKGIFEQVAVNAYVGLKGVNACDGSTVITGHGYMLYDGEHRAHSAACLIEGWSHPERVRWERGREAECLHLKLIVEDLPDDRNRVVLDGDGMPVLEFYGHSEYARRGIERARRELVRILEPLPVEDLEFDARTIPTEGHMLGTVVMGNDTATSVVDRYLVHHTLRNLVVLGSSAFPTGSPANPTLTLSALSMRTARYLVS